MDKQPISQKKGKRKINETAQEKEDEDIKKQKLDSKISDYFFSKKTPLEEDTSIYEEALESSVQSPQKTAVQQEMDNDQLYRMLTERIEAAQDSIKTELKSDIRESETKITTKVETIQKDVSEMKEKQLKQEENVNKLTAYQDEISKRLEYLQNEKREKTSWG